MATQPKKTPNSSAPDLFMVISDMAQELQGPLQSLAARSQKLLEEYKSRDFEYISYKDFKNIMATLEQMNRQIQRCYFTTSRMVSVGKQKAQLSSGTCQVNAVIEEILTLFHRQLESTKIKVVSRLVKDLPEVRLGKVECYQVIHNVLLNAIQAMPAGGKVLVRTSLDQDKRFVVIDIEDEGVGITPEHLSKVFEPFFTTKERGKKKNTGLGLSVVYATVHSTGGDVHIQSSLRKGTKVHIDLPAANSSS